MCIFSFFSEASGPGFGLTSPATSSLSWKVALTSYCNSESCIQGSETFSKYKMAADKNLHPYQYNTDLAVYCTSLEVVQITPQSPSTRRRYKTSIVKLSMKVLESIELKKILLC